MEYDVAISFATTDEQIAIQVYNKLSRRGLSTYYYIEQPGENLGEDLVESLRRIYSNTSIVVVIHSRNYRTPYTEIELESALSGVASRNGIVSVLLDESPLPEGLQNRVFWKSYEGVDQVVDLVAIRVCEKVESKFNKFCQLLRDFEIEYNLYRNYLEKITSLATKASSQILPKDVKISQSISIEYTSMLSKLLLQGESIRKVFQSNNELTASRDADDLAKLTIRLESLADKSIHYQVKKLGSEGNIEHLPFETVLSLRQGLLKVLTNYNTEFTKSLFQYDDQFTKIRQGLLKHKESYHNRLARLQGGYKKI